MNEALHENVDLDEVRSAVQEGGGKWIPGETPLLLMSARERHSRLGVELDEVDLAELRGRTPVDLAQIMVRTRLLRTPRIRTFWQWRWRMRCSTRLHG